MGQSAAPPASSRADTSTRTSRYICRRTHTVRVKDFDAGACLLADIVERLIGGAPLSGYGVRFSSPSVLTRGGTVCSTGPNGLQTCAGTGSNVFVGPGGSSLGQQLANPSGTALSEGPFKGWQYWQASVAMQLTMCLVAVLLSAFLLPPIRRLRFWRGDRGLPPI